MKELLSFLNRLEKHNIFYTLHHHRDNFVMVKIDLPGERWEVEFDEEGEVEIEIFSLSSGLSSDKSLLEKIFVEDTGLGFELQITLKDPKQNESFITEMLSNVIEPLGLALGGNPFYPNTAFVSLFRKGNVDDELRQKCLDMIQNHLEVKTCYLSEIKN